MLQTSLLLMPDICYARCYYKFSEIIYSFTFTFVLLLYGWSEGKQSFVCVEFIDDSTLITVGTSGIDISTDYGYKWSPIDTIYNLNVIKSINDSLIYAAGNGVIVKILK